jgi:hypothetical protein
MIAQMLQMQFDREHDAALGVAEHQANGSSKVTVSFEKYRVVPDNPIWDDSDDDDEDLEAYLNQDERKRNWYSYLCCSSARQSHAFDEGIVAWRVISKQILLRP